VTDRQTDRHTHTHTHSFNGPFSGTTQVSQYQKGKTNLDFTEARDSEWQWHQLGHMQVCTLLQTDTMPALHHSVLTGRMPFMPPNQQRQSTEGSVPDQQTDRQKNRHGHTQTHKDHGTSLCTQCGLILIL